jgi:hypothetical protein
MVKLVDMPDLGSGAARRVGSSPIIRTKTQTNSLGFFVEKKDEKFMLSVAEVSPIIRTKKSKR